MGLNNIASATPAAPGTGITNGRRLPVAPQPPHEGGLSLVTVNQTALVHSGLDSPESFVFRKDSAGLGIPRNELGDLKWFSEHAVQKGSAATPIYLMSNGIRGASNGPSLVVIQRGVAPSYDGFSRAEPSSSFGSTPSRLGSATASAQVGARSTSTPSAPATTSTGASGSSRH